MAEYYLWVNICRLITTAQSLLRLSCSPLCSVSFVLTPELTKYYWLLVILRVSECIK